MTRSGEEHIAIVNAVASGDAELTAELTRSHLIHSRGIRAGWTEDEADA
ncbi:hypothetical protein [Streptomyces qinglanensis]